jgi:hypothetical protein
MSVFSSKRERLKVCGYIFLNSSARKRQRRPTLSTTGSHLCVKGLLSSMRELGEDSKIESGVRGGREIFVFGWRLALGGIAICIAILIYDVLDHFSPAFWRWCQDRGLDCVERARGWLFGISSCYIDFCGQVVVVFFTAPVVQFEQYSCLFRHHSHP